MIKKLFEIAGKNKKKLIQGTILKVIESGFKGAPLIFLGLTLNELFSASINTQKIILLSFGLAACYILQAIFHYWTDVVNYPTTLRIARDLRIRLGEHIRKLSMGFFSERQAGDLNKVINEDVQNIHALPHHIHPQLVSAIALPTFIALFLLFLDWRMALATILVIPVALVILFKSQPLFKRLAKLRAKAAAEANSRIIEYIQGIGVIKAFGQIGEWFRKFEVAVADYKRTNVDLVKKIVPPDIAFSAILGSGLAIILLAGSYLFLGGELSLNRDFHVIKYLPNTHKNQQKSHTFAYSGIHYRNIVTNFMSLIACC